MTDSAIDTTVANKQLKELLSRANDNQEKIDRMHSAELELLQSESLTELLDYLFKEHTTLFQLLSVNLILIDNEQNIHRLLQETSDATKYKRHLKLIQDKESIQQIKELQTSPQLSRYESDAHAWLITDHESEIKSIAILPLIRHAEVIGVATCTSMDYDRFQPGLGTDLLKRLATILAISIENAVNYHHLQYLGLTDGLTGVRNRRFLDQRLAEEISAAIHSNKPLVFLFIDIDYFKKINDKHGHQSGDKVLQQVARLIYDQLRAVDILSRYGGEEFAVLLKNQTLEGARRIAERIRTTIYEADINSRDKINIPVTVSIGVAELNQLKGDEHNIEQIAYRLTQAADSALYQAKENGRDQVVISDPA